MQRLVLLLRVVLVALALAVGAGLPPGMAGPAMAQGVAQEAPDYESWESVASRAEEVIGASRASDAAFEDLRSELVEWRERFLAAQDTNAARIETVRDQIEALGPPPAEGETEAEEVAARRAELNETLSGLLGPARRAEEAFRRAEGLIREIDSILRERQAEALLERAPTPLNPARWPAAWSRMAQSISGVLTEVRGNWSSSARQTALRNDLPITIGLLLVALVLLVRGRIWMERLTAKVFERFSDGIAGFFVSTGQVIVPTLGIYLLMAALESTGLLGLRGQAVVGALPSLVLAFYGALWVAGRVFPKTGETLLTGSVELDTRSRLRWLAGALGLVIGLSAVALALAEQDDYALDLLAMVEFPFIVLEGLLLLRIGQILGRQAKEMRADEDVGFFHSSVLGFISRASVVISVAGIGLGAAGYTVAASNMVLPTALTLGYLGVLLVLNKLIHDIHALVTGLSEQESREALIPTLVTFALVIVSLPALALIWGVRPAELTELWTTVREGFTVGDTRISPGDFLTFLVVFAIGYGLTRLFQNALKTAVLPKTRLDPGGRNAITAGVGYVGIFLAAVIAITSAGLDLSSLAIVAGALSVGIGFGLQNIVSNFVSGIILLIERPVGQGHWVEGGGNMGIVRAISVRSTTIETFDKTQVIVPNADFVSGTVTNWTRGNATGRLIVNVGVAYGTDTRRVSKILEEVAEAQPLVVVNPPPMILFAGFGADALEFEVRCILRDVNYILDVKNEINHEIARRFAEEGIEIPFAQRDIWLRNPETLRTAAGRSAPDGSGPAPGRPPAAAARAQLTEDDMDAGGSGEGEGR